MCKIICVRDTVCIQICRCVCCIYAGVFINVFRCGVYSIIPGVLVKALAIIYTGYLKTHSLLLYYLNRVLEIPWL